jgi:two-component system, LytTR family, sensor kinase
MDRDSPTLNRYLRTLTAHYAEALSRRQFFLIVGLFWVYVTISNVLYAYGMRTGIAKVTNLPLFAPWDARVLQHLFLLPLLMVCYWASMRIQWRPVLVALPLQIVLALALAGLAYPAMILGEYAVLNHLGHAPKHDGNPFADPMVMSMWFASFVSFLPTYGFGLALVTGAALYTKFRKSELQRAALEREWGAARLAALRMQLSPHTLFNLLHTIRGLIEWDPKGAQSMVVQLADLLRRLLNAGERDYSRLADELKFVRLYLELQQKRFADRLSIHLPAAADVVDAWVPSLILQPLVENAVVHGLAGHQGPVSVRVGAYSSGDLLVLRVTNTIAPAKVAGPEGIGMSNVRERLAVQFEGRAGMVAGPFGEEWVSEITLPEIHASPDRRTETSALAPA